jgi:hypothetical protein
MYIKEGLIIIWFGFIRAKRLLGRLGGRKGRRRRRYARIYN